MNIEVFDDADTVARQAATFVAERARRAVAARGRFVFAVSGGTTPWQMLRALASEAVPWPEFHVVQVDERIAPAGDPDRNWTHVRESLLSHAPVPAGNLHPMPVEAADLSTAASAYMKTLIRIAGEPPVIDLVHLGLGPDGHTASLVPGDDVLNVAGDDVALTDVYQGRRRMTLTYPILNRAREILWLATGAAKTEMLRRLVAADPAIPAGRIRQDNATALVDRPAAAELDLGATA
jgi:6-phosphogluconolactonase